MALPSWASGEAITSSKLNGMNTQIDTNETDILGIATNATNIATNQTNIGVINARRAHLWSWACADNAPLRSDAVTLFPVIINEIILPTGFTQIYWSVRVRVTGDVTSADLEVEAGTTGDTLLGFTDTGFTIKTGTFNISGEAKDTPINFQFKLKRNNGSGGNFVHCINGSLWATV